MAKKYIVAAGGVVYKNTKNGIEIKIIKNYKNKWTLPKGKLDKNEGIEKAAIREVKEECGADAEIEAYLGKMQYKIKEGRKIVHIYLMKCIKDNPFNDPDGEVIKAAWKSPLEALDLIDRRQSKEMILLAVECLSKKK